MANHTQLCSYTEYSLERFDHLIWALANLSGCDSLQASFDVPAIVPEGRKEPVFYLRGDIKGSDFGDSISAQLSIPLQVIAETCIEELEMPTALGSHGFTIGNDFTPSNKFGEKATLELGRSIKDGKTRAFVEWFLKNKLQIRKALRRYRHPGEVESPPSYSKLGKIVI